MHFNIPFVLFTLNLLALNAHGHHAGDVILAVNDAATITTSTIAATGVVTARVFGATFGDTGVSRFTTNPGFDAVSATFSAGSRVGFAPLSGLQRWTGAGVEPVSDERLEVKYLTLQTIIGVTPAVGFDLAVQSNGGWHRHLNFRLFTAGAKLPASALYIVELEMYSTDGVTLPSAPMWMVFNDGASVAEHDAAIAWVTTHLARSGSNCIADLDGNGDVGASDLAAVLGAWGTASGDLTEDGATDASDLSALLASWGPCT